MQRLFSIIVHRRSHLARFFSSAGSVPHVAVVGSGPAGFYTAQQLLKVGITLSMFDVLCVLCVK